MNKEKLLDTKIFVPNTNYIEFQSLIKKSFGETNSYQRSEYYFILNSKSIPDVLCETPVSILRTQKFFYNHSDLPKSTMNDLRSCLGIQTIKPTDFVLVRNDEKENFILDVFSYELTDSYYPFVCIKGDQYKQCIPFKGNEHLLNKNG